MAYYPQTPYMPQGASQTYYQPQGPPYPEHYPGEAYPSARSRYQDPNQAQQSYYPPQPHQQSPAWNPEQIWAEQNGTSQPQNKGFGDLIPPQGQYSTAPSQNGERGVGATLLGGGAGAFLGHEMGHGKLATIGGLAIGAIAANAFEHHHEKKKRAREESRAYDDGYVSGEHRSRSRGLDDEDYSGTRRGIDEEREYEDERYYNDPPRHHHHHHHGRDEYNANSDCWDNSYSEREEDYYNRDY